MRCQLARIIQPKDKDMHGDERTMGFLCWVQDVPPIPGGICHGDGAYLFYEETATLHYVPNRASQRVAIPNNWLERLPVFRDVTPISILDWYDHGGEPNPRLE